MHPELALVVIQFALAKLKHPPVEVRTNPEIHVAQVWPGLTQVAQFG